MNVTTEIVSPRLFFFGGRGVQLKLLNFENPNYVRKLCFVTTYRLRRRPTQLETIQVETPVRCQSRRDSRDSNKDGREQQR